MANDINIGPGVHIHDIGPKGLEPGYYYLITKPNPVINHKYTIGHFDGGSWIIPGVAEQATMSQIIKYYQVGDMVDKPFEKTIINTDEHSVVITHNDNGFKVTHGERFAPELSYEEMLGLISVMTMPLERPCIHWLRTKEEHHSGQKFLCHESCGPGDFCEGGKCHKNGCFRPS